MQLDEELEVVQHSLSLNFVKLSVETLRVSDIPDYEFRGGKFGKLRSPAITIECNAF